MTWHDEDEGFDFRRENPSSTYAELSKASYTNDGSLARDTRGLVAYRRRRGEGPNQSFSRVVVRRFDSRWWAWFCEPAEATP